MPGLFFEQFEVGAEYQHALSRSVTQFDNIWYSCITLNTQPLHLNIDFSVTKSPQKKPLFNSLYTMSVVLGQANSELTRGTMIETVRVDDVEYPRSVFADDTLYSRTKVLGLEPCTDRDDAGIVELYQEGLNQHGEVIMTCRRKVMVRRAPAAA